MALLYSVVMHRPYKTPKLVDCDDHAPNSELYIVEGDSAASSINRVRDPAFQAILPMQGKPMNAIKASLKDIQKNIQFAALIEALGVDLEQTETIEQVRYRKIILLFDPDPDGIHARTLMLLFFYRYFPQLLDESRVFDVHAPQWAVLGDGMTVPQFAGTPEHLAIVRQELRDSGVTGLKTRRFRGLGSIDVSLLGPICVSPATRTLVPLSREYAQHAMDFFVQLRPK